MGFDMGTQAQGHKTGPGDNAAGAPQPCTTSLPSLGESEAGKVQINQGRAWILFTISKCHQPSRPLPSPPHRLRWDQCRPFQQSRSHSGSITRFLPPHVMEISRQRAGPGELAVMGQPLGRKPPQCPALCQGGAAWHGPDCLLIIVITSAHSGQGWIMHHPQPFLGEG